MKSLEERLSHLEARAAIEDLVVSYFLAADGDDAHGVGKCFTDDAEFRSSGVLNASGRQAIVDFIGKAREQMGLTVHTPNYTRLTSQKEAEASGLVGAHLEMVVGGVAIFGAVRYVDRYVRQAETWLIRSRDMRTIYLAPWLEAGTALNSQTPVRWPGASPSSSDFPRKGPR